MGFFSDHFGGLVRFAGREDRKPFWLWVFAVMATMFVLWMVVLGLFISAAVARVEQFARDHPDQVIRSGVPGNTTIEIQGYHPELIPDFGTIVNLCAVMALVAVLLLAAAVARRLHDGGRSGWWGLAPLPFLFGGVVLMSRLVATFADMMVEKAPPDTFLALFGVLFANNLIYLGMLVMLVVMCTKPSQPGPNRFGEGHDMEPQRWNP